MKRIIYIFIFAIFITPLSTYAQDANTVPQISESEKMKIDIFLKRFEIYSKYGPSEF